MIRRRFIQSLLGIISLGGTTARGTTRPPGPHAIAHPLPGESAVGSLETWLRLPIQPVWRIPEFEILDAPDHPFYLVLHAIRQNEPLEIRYHGGATPGASRTISPALVFRKLLPNDPTPDHLAPLYVLAWCHTRNQLTPSASTKSHSNRHILKKHIIRPQDYRLENLTFGIRFH